MRLFFCCGGRFFLRSEEKLQVAEMNSQVAVAYITVVLDQITEYGRPTGGEHSPVAASHFAAPQLRALARDAGHDFPSPSGCFLCGLGIIALVRMLNPLITSSPSLEVACMTTMIIIIISS